MDVLSEVADEIFAIKDKLTDQEYKSLLEKIGKVSKLNLYSISYIVPKFCEEDLVLEYNHAKKIVKLDKESFEEIQNEMTEHGVAFVDVDAIGDSDSAEFNLAVPYIETDIEEEKSLKFQNVNIGEVIVFKIEAII